MLSPCRCPRTLCPLARVLASFSMPRIRAVGLRNFCSALGEPRQAHARGLKPEQQPPAGAETELRPAGHLHLIIGPMFAGKTSELLQHLTKHEVRREAAARHAPLTLSQEAGRRILVAKSDRDRRYAASEVVSHNGLRRVRSGAGCETPARALSRRRTACPRRAQPVFAVWTGGVREGGRGRRGRGTQPTTPRMASPLTCCAGSVLSGPQGVLHPGCGQGPQAGAGGWAGRRLSEGAFRRGARSVCALRCVQGSYPSGRCSSSCPTRTW